MEDPPDLHVHYGPAPSVPRSLFPSLKKLNKIIKHGRFIIMSLAPKFAYSLFTFSIISMVGMTTSRATLEHTSF